MKDSSLFLEIFWQHGTRKAITKRDGFSYAVDNKAIVQKVQNINYLPYQ